MEKTLKLLKLLADNLKAKLDTLERKPAWLSGKSAIDKGTISRLLNQDGPSGNPSLSAIVAYGTALEIPPEFLLLSEQESNLLRIFRGLEPRERKAIIGNAEVLASRKNSQGPSARKESN